jgi:Flp pilus assembly pilin Flp
VTLAARVHKALLALLVSVALLALTAHLAKTVQALLLARC